MNLFAQLQAVDRWLFSSATFARIFVDYATNLVLVMAKIEEMLPQYSHKNSRDFWSFKESAQDADKFNLEVDKGLRK